MPGLVNKSDPESHGGGGVRDDLGTRDEVKVFKDEGEEEYEENASESLHADLLEEKSSLIQESEHTKKFLPELARFPNPYSLGYLGSPYGAYASSHGPFPHFGTERLISPPPAHMGSLPYERPNLPSSSFSPSPYQHPLHSHLSPSPYSPLGLDQLAAWQFSMYQQPRPPYPHPFSAAFPRLPSSESIPPHLLPTHHLPHVKSENGHLPGLAHKDVGNENPGKAGTGPHIKKPLNAFMLYMKEMRPIVQAECTLKESAAINQILGRRWHGLAREEQAVYYERAREERKRHQELYPNWNARDNYRAQKPKKRKRDKIADPAANIKKCRARYGMEQQSLWCKPCKRKKKCIRVQMYLAGHSEQEIDDTCAVGDNKGDVGDLARTGSDDESQHSQEGSEEFNDQLVPSPELSIPSLDSPGSHTRSPTPGSSQQWSIMQHSASYRAGPVGSDPRDSSNPLSISFLTGNQWQPEHWDSNK